MANWAEEVTAVATVVLAVGAVAAIGAAVFAGQQVREARIGRQAEVAADFFRRWSDDSMVASRRLVASYGSPESLRDALLRHITANDVEAYVLFRELDYFEQLGAMEEHGGFDFDLVETLLGQKLVDRFDLWSRRSTPSVGPRPTRTSSNSPRRCARRARVSPRHDHDAGGDAELLAAQGRAARAGVGRARPTRCRAVSQAREPHPQLRGCGGRGAAAGGDRRVARCGDGEGEPRFTAVAGAHACTAGRQGRLHGGASPRRSGSVLPARSRPPRRLAACRRARSRAQAGARARSTSTSSIRWASW